MDDSQTSNSKSRKLGAEAARVHRSSLTARGKTQSEARDICAAAVYLRADTVWSKRSKYAHAQGVIERAGRVLRESVPKSEREMRKPCSQNERSHSWIKMQRNRPAGCWKPLEKVSLEILTVAVVMGEEGGCKMDTIARYSKNGIHRLIGLSDAGTKIIGQTWWRGSDSVGKVKVMEIKWSKSVYSTLMWERRSSLMKIFLSFQKLLFLVLEIHSDKHLPTAIETVHVSRDSFTIKPTLYLAAGGYVVFLNTCFVSSESACEWNLNLKQEWQSPPLTIKNDNYKI